MIKIDNFILKTGDYELFTTEQIVLQKGEKMLLFGNNGTGKSLFLKSLHKRYFNHNGNFEIINEGLFKKKKRATLLIENQINLIPDQSVYKNIILPLTKVNDKTVELISDLCNIAKLGEIYNVKCSTLSYSQAKMVEIIRAVIVNPILILIDDIDNYFDDLNLNSAFEIFNNSKGKFSLIATSKRNLEKFDSVCRIQNQKVVQL